MIRQFAHRAGARFAGPRSACRNFVLVTALAGLSLPASLAFAQQQVPPRLRRRLLQPLLRRLRPSLRPSQPYTVPPPLHRLRHPSSPSRIRRTLPHVSPTRRRSTAFLHASWGYDTNRVWEVAAILKTPVDRRISKVVVFVGDKSGKQKPSALAFFTMPDGKHLIAGNQIIDFGANPYADYRAQIQQRANGPYRGAASKNSETSGVCRFPVPGLQRGAGKHGKACHGFSAGSHCLPVLSSRIASTPRR